MPLAPTSDYSLNSLYRALRQHFGDGVRLVWADNGEGLSKGTEPEYATRARAAFEAWEMRQGR